MKRIGTVLLAWALAPHAGALQAQTAPPPVGGRLAGAVLLGEAPLLPSDLPGDLSSSDRLRLTAYIERARAVASRSAGVAASGAAAGRRTRLEREIMSVIERDGIEEAARAIAGSPGPFGVAGTIDPDAEAAWIEALLRDARHPVAAPFLYALLASRYRLQLERTAEDRPALERLAKKYKTMLERVRNAGDGLFILLADDLDNRVSLSAGATRHPRQYLPDT